jgi:hypothetical protein
MTIHHGHYVPPFPSQRTGKEIPVLAEAYRGLNVAAEAIVARQAELADDPNFTKAGKKAQLQAWVRDHGVPALKKAREAVAAAEASARTIQANLSRSTVDKTDVAGAMIRSEVRARLQKMDDATRVAMLQAPGLDPTTAAAILEAPPWLSGVTADQHSRIMAAQLAVANPEAVESITGIEEAADAVAGAHRATMRVIMAETGLLPFELEQALDAPTLSQRLAEQLAEDFPDSEGGEA